MDRLLDFSKWMMHALADNAFHFPPSLFTIWNANADEQLLHNLIIFFSFKLQCLLKLQLQNVLSDEFGLYREIAFMNKVCTNNCATKIEIKRGRKKRASC